MRPTTRHPARLLIALGAATAVVFMMTASAWAGHAPIEISIPVETVIRAPADTTRLLETAEVPTGFADHLCEVAAHAENQRSTHPGNDLVIESGDSRVVLADVEAQPGQVIETEELLELGEQITVSLVMGRDGVFSAGIEVIVECLGEETTTTEEIAPTQETSTTAETAPTQETSTTAEVAPTDETSTTAEVAPAEVTSTLAPSSSIEDEVLGTEVLPFTGTADSRMGLLALAILAAGALLLAASRRVDDPE
jgi:hypothetical protein